MVEVRDARSDRNLDILKIQLTGFTDRLNIGSETEKGSIIGERQLLERHKGACGTLDCTTPRSRFGKG